MHQPYVLQQHYLINSQRSIHSVTDNGQFDISLCVCFQALSAGDKKCFEDMAKADKVRYNREMSDYVPPKGFGKRGRKRKDPNAPKRPP